MPTKPLLPTVGLSVAAVSVTTAFEDSPACLGALGPSSSLRNSPTDLSGRIPDFRPQKAECDFRRHLVRGGVRGKLGLLFGVMAGMVRHFQTTTAFSDHTIIYR